MHSSKREISRDKEGVCKRRGGHTDWRTLYYALTNGPGVPSRLDCCCCGCDDDDDGVCCCVLLLLGVGNKGVLEGDDMPVTAAVMAAAAALTVGNIAALSCELAATAGVASPIAILSSGITSTEDSTHTCMYQGFQGLNAYSLLHG